MLRVRFDGLDQLEPLARVIFILSRELAGGVCSGKARDLQ